jgi:hypothetical protein
VSKQGSRMALEQGKPLNTRSASYYSLPSW